MDQNGLPNFLEMLQGIEIDCDTSQNRHLALLKGKEVRLLIDEMEVEGYEGDDDEDEDDLIDEDELLDDDGFVDAWGDEDDDEDEEDEECDEECKACKRVECLVDEAPDVELKLLVWVRDKRSSTLADEVAAKILPKKGKNKNGSLNWKKIHYQAAHGVPKPLMRFINLVLATGVDWEW